MGDIIGIVVAIVAIYFMQPELFAADSGASISVETAFAAGFAGGFVGAYISTGSLSAALTAGLIAGVTAAAFAEVGSYASHLATEGSEWAKPFSVLAHAAVGCVSGAASGGNCGRGALAAGLSEAATRAAFLEPPAKSLASWGTFRGTAEAGLIGGAAAEITGGKFDDGFSVAAAGYIFNDVAHSIANPDTPGKNDVVIQRDDGTIEVRSGGSVSWRDNNPGNMISGVGPYASIGMNQGFAVFPDYQTGYDAMVYNLEYDPRYQSGTVGSAIATWAPASVGNDPVTYANTVSSWTGLSINTPMNSLTLPQMQSVAGAIQRYEGWNPGTAKIIDPE
ncbi:MAG: hypothetical protein ACREQ5_01715 [Candidatus Dormibacteria bacterium]